MFSTGFRELIINSDAGVLAVGSESNTAVAAGEPRDYLYRK